MSESLFANINMYWICLAFIVMPIAIKIKAPYGRHVQQGWGPLLDNKWGWILMEMPTLICCLVMFFSYQYFMLNISFGFILIFSIHYINRIFIYPLRIKTKGKKIPLSIVLMAFLFNVINGTNIGFELAVIKQYDYAWISSPQFIIGILLFVVGLSINWWSDHTLIHLRKPEESSYKIPKGFLFTYISCPNYFGEILEWIGFAVMTWSISGLAFAIWTFANLIPRSLNHHTWYKETFEEYPSERKAVIPFLL